MEASINPFIPIIHTEEFDPKSKKIYVVIEPPTYAIEDRNGQHGVIVKVINHADGECHAAAVLKDQQVIGLYFNQKSFRFDGTGAFMRPLLHLLFYANKRAPYTFSKVGPLFDQTLSLVLTSQGPGSYISPKMTTSPVGDLLFNGVTVLDLKSAEAIVPYWKAVIQTMPEYLPSAKQYSATNDGILSVPSSFHNPLVRNIREALHFHVVKHVSPLVLRSLTYGQDSRRVYLQQIIGEMQHKANGENMLRYVRDQPLNAENVVYQLNGWVNCSKTPEVFSFIANSHRDIRGTQKLADDSHVRNDIRIPPGCVVLYDPRLMHKKAKTREQKIRRLTVSFAFTYEATTPTEANSMTPNLQEVLKEQAQVGVLDMFPVLYDKLKPPQFPSEKEWDKVLFFPQVHKQDLVRDKRLQLKADQIAKWSIETFVPNALIAVEGRRLAHIPSLAKASLPLYPPYTSKEMQMYYPSRSWDISGEVLRNPKAIPLALGLPTASNLRSTE